MIATSPQVGYIHEPFNLNHRPGICSAKFDYWFPYISEENEHIYQEHIHRTLCFSYNLAHEAKEIKSPKDAPRLARNFVNFLKYRISNRRPLLKDPIALFSAEWLASKFKMIVVVSIRHPAAFASSLKRLNWTHPFSHFLDQPLLMRDHLFPFESEISDFVAKKRDIIDQAILLWKLIHYMIIKYKKNNPDWIFLRHEDFSRDPVHSFKNLFKDLNLEFTEHVHRLISKYSDSSNPSEALEGCQSIKRDSKSNIFNWKKRLTHSEIKRVRTKLEDISGVFYSDEDW